METEKTYKNNQNTVNKTAVSTCLLIITLNGNGLNAPIKRHTIPEWIKKKKTRPIYMSGYRRLTAHLKAHRLKVKGREKVFRANGKKSKQSSNTYIRQSIL